MEPPANPARFTLVKLDCGSCVRHVVSLQCSIREWALRQSWGGRPVRVEQVQGILVAALGVLARYYGYGDAARSPAAKR